MAEGTPRAGDCPPQGALPLDITRSGTRASKDEAQGPTFLYGPDSANRLHTAVLWPGEG